MKSKRCMLALFLCLAVIVPSAPEPQAQELKTVRFAYSAISTAYLPLWIGTEAKISQA